MTGEIKVIDLRENGELIRPYVDLRNRYVDLLLTREVAADETVDWLAREDVEVRCLVEGEVLTGAVVLYMARGGEIAFFAREPGRGTGSALLRIIEGVAAARGLGSVWAWVLGTNAPAMKTFAKNRYIIEGKAEKLHKGSPHAGFVLRKRIP